MKQTIFYYQQFLKFEYHIISLFILLKQGSMSEHDFANQFIEDSLLQPTVSSMFYCNEARKYLENFFHEELGSTWYFFTSSCIFMYE